MKQTKDEQMKGGGMKNVGELNELWGKLIHSISFNDISRIEMNAEMSWWMGVRVASVEGI